MVQTIQKEKSPCPQGTETTFQRTGPKPKISFNEPACNNRPSFQRLHVANQTLPVIPFTAKAHAGIARRGGRSPSVARKLPEQKPRSPRGMVGYGRPLKADPWEWKYTTSPAGSSGGSAEGASEGRQPLTGPHLPPPEAAQTREKEKPPRPQGAKAASQRTSLLYFLQSARRAYPAAQAPHTQRGPHFPMRAS